jgi:YHS domain-containing protein
VQIVGLKEHSVGTLGRVTTATEITRLMTDGYRLSGAQREAAPGTAIDPVCSMTVDLATATITLEHDGTLYAFCAPVCKKVFSEELAG